jgi:hypothetical protein
MRLIDSVVLKKALDEQIKDFSTREDQECFRFAEEIIDGIPTAKAIPTEWLHKKLIDLLYDGKASEEALHVFHRLIGDWEKQQ